MRGNSMFRSNSGFTLVELSIVLVIIGLIVASVLVGQNLIRSAEIRASVTQYEQFNSAVAAFRGKYNLMPGDVKGATKFGFTGDGGENGLLAGSTALTGENVFFWNHLGASGAGLISGTYVGTSAGPTSSDINTFLPAAKAGGYWGVFSASGANYYIVGVAGAAQGIYATSNVLSPLDAQSLDTKIDDGRPGRGTVLAREQHATDADTAATLNATAAATYCTIGASVTAATYNTQFSTLECTLRLAMKL